MSAHTLLSLRPWIGAIVRIGPDAQMDEVHWDPGMLALVTDIAIDDVDVFIVELDTRPFTDHNTPLMQPTYYDKHKVPCLTAVEANQWVDVDTWYLDEPKSWSSKLSMLGKGVSGPIHMWTDGRQRIHLSMFTDEQQANQWKRDPFPATLESTVSRFLNTETTL